MSNQIANPGKMGDYISRAEANGDDFVRRADIVEKFMDRLPSISVNYLCKIADDIPAADVRPVVRGEWIMCNDACVCSNCGNPVAFKLMPDGWHVGDFCTKCGADMRPEPAKEADNAR